MGHYLMFEIGKTYRITMVGGGPEDTFKGPLRKYDYPLISIELGQGERIININSPSFIRADRHDAETLAEIHARQETLRSGGPA
jgi:hypothetical protein